METERQNPQAVAGSPGRGLCGQDRSASHLIKRGAPEAPMGSGEGMCRPEAGESGTSFLQLPLRANGAPAQQQILGTGVTRPGGCEVIHQLPGSLGRGLLPGA